MKRGAGGYSAGGSGKRSYRSLTEEFVLDYVSLRGRTGSDANAVVYIRLMGNREDPPGVSPDGKYALVAEVERAGSEIHVRPER